MVIPKNIASTNHKIKMLIKKVKTPSVKMRRGKVIRRIMGLIKKLTIPKDNPP